MGPQGRGAAALANTVAAMLCTPAFEQETDRLTGTRIRDGNTVVLLPTGVESYAKRWELIEGARHSIHLASFSVIRDDTSRRLADLVRAKVRQGVEVTLIADDAALYTTRSRPILESMARGGAEILTYNNPFRYLSIDRSRGHPVRQLTRGAKVAIKRRFHEKYLVVDGRQAVLGGMNWGTKYALGGSDPRYWRDTDVFLTGPVVDDIEDEFLADVAIYRTLRTLRRDGALVGLDPEPALAEARAGAAPPVTEPSPPTADERIRYVHHKPWDQQALPLTNAALQLIKHAQHSIHWGCHGVRPPRLLAEALGAAAGRGVEVHLLTNSRVSSRSLTGKGLLGAMYWECHNHFRWLLDHGVHVYEWQHPGAFHSKNIVVDGVVAGVGSYNVANGSAFHHSEGAVFVYGGDFPNQVRDLFTVDLESCRELSAADVRPPRPRVDPLRRTLHERYLLVDESVMPAGVAADLAAGNYRWKYAERPPG